MRGRKALIPYAHIPAAPGVYRLVNTITGDCYVGSSKNMQARCAGHEWCLRVRRHIQRLQKNFRRFGAAAFRFEVLEEWPKCDFSLCEREQHWTDKLKPTLNTRLTVEARVTRNNESWRTRLARRAALQAA